jgi:hypothetical protein
MPMFSFMKGPIERQVTSKAEFRRPIDIDTLQDLVNQGMAPMRKKDPSGAALVDQQIVKNVVAVAREAGGVFTLQGLEKFNESINVTQSGLGRLAGASQETRDNAAILQLGTAMLVQICVAWVNAGRPEVATAEKLPLSLAHVRAAVEKDVADAGEKGYVMKLLAAFEAKHGDSITMKQLRSFHDEVNAAHEAMKAKADARQGAGLSPDRAADGARHELVLQSLGYYRLDKFLKFSADQGELGALAAGVKPGAAAALAGGV